MEAKTIGQSRITIGLMMGPEHANVMGNVHGGMIMKFVDEAGALAAMRHARSPVVTVAIDSMTFMEPVLVGYMVWFNAELTYAGRTSMEARVEVVAENPLTGECTNTNSAYVVYVALNSQTRKPEPVPVLVAETPQEQARMAQAQQRQDERKSRRRQL